VELLWKEGRKGRTPSLPFSPGKGRISSKKKRRRTVLDPEEAGPKMSHVRGGKRYFCLLSRRERGMRRSGSGR